MTRLSEIAIRRLAIGNRQSADYSNLYSSRFKRQHCRGNSPNLIKQGRSNPGETTLKDLRELKNKHHGQPAFCLGTAPHLNQLDLALIRDRVSIGCNQLALRADELRLDYVCFQRQERFLPVREQLADADHPRFLIPQGLLQEQGDWSPPSELEERVYPFNLRFATPGHAETFSFDLANCIYAGDSLAIQIQLAVWMGCRPIYILGVDAAIADAEHPFFDTTTMDEQTRRRVNCYSFPELAQWLENTRHLLWARGIRLFNAAASASSLETLPKCRLQAAVGRPRIAVTSKTFCQDEYLVHELKRYFSEIDLNQSSEKLAGAKLVEFLAEADGMILGTEPFSAEVMAELPCLRYVSKYGVGLNNVDFDAAKRQQIEVSYKKGVNSDSVAELTLAFALMLLRRIDPSIQGYRQAKWRKLPGRELAESTLGIVGYGHVGKVVAAKFAALGVGRLLVNDLLDFPRLPPCEFAPLDYLLEQSDIVTIHVDAEKRNRRLVGREFLGRMRPAAVLINTSRGTVVDEAALARALQNNTLAGAALDVYEDEPEINPELAACANLLTTCHIAGSSNRAIKNMGWAAIEGLLNLFGISPL